MKTTALVIMAAGIGSRFSGGIKQLELVGMNNEIIMDYSVHDAIKAGFNEIIFIIRKDIEVDFKERIGTRIESICKSLRVSCNYCFQDISDIPGQFPSGRTKPWGTGHAVLSSKHLIHSPFAVINADDYYGKEAFVKMHDWLIQEHEDNTYSLMGFLLNKTLSEHGCVTRGICKTHDNHVLDIIETSNIVKKESGVIESEGIEIDGQSVVSMNMWGFSSKDYNLPQFINILQEGFISFFDTEVEKDPLKSEYLLPNFIGELLKCKSVCVELLQTNDQWLGITYKEDAPAVKRSFEKMISDGVYPTELYSDLLY